MTKQHEGSIGEDGAEDDGAARRDFIKKCGKFAVVVPPAMAILLTQTSSPATATSPPVAEGPGDTSV